MTGKERAFSRFCGKTRYQDILAATKKYFFSPIGEFIYPRVCEHCADPLETSQKLLCRNCLGSFSFVDHSARCKRCLSFLEEENSSLCESCREKPHFFTKLSATLEYNEAAQTLWKKFESDDEPYLDTCVSLMVMQFVRLEYPIPDWVIPAPSKKTNKKLLAKKLAAKIGSSYGDFLQSEREFCQKGKSRSERDLLSENLLSWKGRENLCDKTILLIDDILVSGKTMCVTSSKLQEAFPKAIYGLVFCIS